MKSKFTIIALLVSSTFCNAQYLWHALPSAPISWRFDDFYFINPTVGWAINPNYDYLTPNQYGRIFKTTDGGNTWQILKDSANTFFRSVGFADSDVGWVGNLADTIDTNTAGIPLTSDTIPLYQTNDGGITWHPAALPNPHPAGICGISVVTDSVVYAYGRFYGPAGYVKTRNKGMSWVFTDMNSLALGLVDGHFFGEDTGFITGMGTDHKAIILATTDGGNTWTPCYHSTGSDTDEVWKIFFPSRNVGYASIEYQGTAYPFSNKYVKTSDGGLTWTEYPFISTYDEEGIGFISDSIGWIGGDSRKSNYKTIDGGATWNIDSTFGVETPPYSSSDPGFFINRFRSIGDTLMYASGNTIYKLDISTTGIKIIQNSPNNISGYPNPATTSITIQSTNQPIYQVAITNLEGQTIFYNNYKSLRVQVDVSALPAGLYIVKVNGSEARKFVKE